MDGIAGIFIASYILGVIYNGNGQDLIDMIKKESGFLKWFVSIAIVYALKSVIGSAYWRVLIGMLIMAFLLNTSKDFFKNLDKVLQNG
jgi:hypothetical protein